MTTTSTAKIRARTEALAWEMVELVRQATLDAVAEALGAPAERPAERRPRTERPSPAEPATRPRPRSRPGPVRTNLFEHYERMAIRRALIEARGRALEAAPMLGLTKSAMYRRMRSLGLRSGHQGLDEAEAPVVAADGPLSLAAYERAALELALREADGDTNVAARVLGVGRSTLYRKLAEHGLAPPSSSRGRPRRR